MKRVAILILLAVSIVRAAEPVPKPRLILAIIIDQFRYDYTTRFQSEYRGGLERLLTRGAVCTNARYQAFPTLTAVGHSTLMTGAPPSISGIIANSWFDRKTGKPVTSVSDSTVRLVGGRPEAGSSPRRLLVSTVGDELKIASVGRSRVFGISLKDRAAILPVGHSADAAYWFDGTTGHFVTSTFYQQELPIWAKQFNDGAAAKYRGQEWLGHKLPADESAYSALSITPFANELIEAFAEQAVEFEKLGKGPATDFLAVSFSANDYVGHKYGFESPEARDTALRTDALLDKLFRRIDALVGFQNVLVVLTADHGVSPTPEAEAARRMPGGRMSFEAVLEAVKSALTKKYGEGKWVSGSGEASVYLDRELIAERKLDRAAVTNSARDAVAALPHVFRVFTYDELLAGNILQDAVGRLMINGFNARRAADLSIVLEPYWMFGEYGASHGSPFGYDTHVPLIFMGPGIRPGRYDEPVAMNDVAPTLATMLNIETPSGSVGRVLSEMFLNPKE